MRDLKRAAKLIGILNIVSLMIPLVMLILILNWLFKITPYQSLEGMPIMICPITCLIGAVIARISFKINSSALSKISLIFNLMLILAPLLYWHIGTLILGV